MSAEPLSAEEERELRSWWKDRPSALSQYVLELEIDRLLATLKLDRERLAALEEALERYGYHIPTCASQYAPVFERPCNCGWDAALAALKGATS